MENYQQLLNMGAPLTSAFRSPTPSILAKRTIRQSMPDLSQMIPQDPQMQMPGGGLGSLSDIGRRLMGQYYPQDQGSAIPVSRLGGI